jgi:hypothetical protein
LTACKGHPHLALVLAFMAVPSGPAAGATPASINDGDARRTAQEHLTRGNALFTHDRFPEALEEFQAAFSLFPSPKLHFNLGQCERALGHDDAAVDHFQRFLDEARDVSPALRAEAERYVGELRARLAEAAARPAPPAPLPPAPPPPAPNTAPAQAPPSLVVTAPAPDNSPRRPLLGRWWFWTAVGVVAVGAAASAFFLLRPRDPACEAPHCFQ